MALTVGTNSYISVADADTYFDARLFSTAWTDADNATKEAALITASRMIDRMQLAGRPADIDQALAFPRCTPIQGFYYNAYTPVERHRYSERPLSGDSRYQQVSWICQDAVPQAVIDATCEEAIARLERGDSERLKAQREGVTDVQVGNVRESYGTARAVAMRGLLSDEAKGLLVPYIAGSARVR